MTICPISIISLVQMPYCLLCVKPVACSDKGLPESGTAIEDSGFNTTNTQGLSQLSAHMQL